MGMIWVYRFAKQEDRILNLIKIRLVVLKLIRRDRWNDGQIRSRLYALASHTMYRSDCRPKLCFVVAAEVRLPSSWLRWIVLNTLSHGLRYRLPPVFLSCTSERTFVIVNFSIHSISSYHFVQDCESLRNWISVKRFSIMKFRCSVII
jgi:hypothetical protein